MNVRKELYLQLCGLLSSVTVTSTRRHYCVVVLLHIITDLAMSFLLSLWQVVPTS